MMKKINNLALLLLIISGIIWGIIGVKGENLVTYTFENRGVINLIYVIFGLAAVAHCVICRWRKRDKKR